jgi:hypothetical protein
VWSDSRIGDDSTNEPSQGTLGARLAERDADRFVGRAYELAACERLLYPESGLSVLLVHGPGGIGKSAMLREVARRAEAGGYTLHWVEGRDVPPTPDALEGLLADARGAEKPLIIFDTFERIASLAAHMRRVLLPSFPETARVIVAGRGRPEDAWFRGGWEGVSAELELAALPEPDGLELLRARGMGAEQAGTVVQWAEGSPLALSLAATAAAADTEWSPGSGLERPELIEELVRRLTDEDVAGPHLPTIGAAAIARVTTPELLREAVPGCDPAAEFEWLASLNTTEPLGEGIAYHDLVARTLGAVLRRRDPDLERDLRRRIAEHLYERAVETGRLMLSIDLSHLVEDPVVRAGFSWGGSALYHLEGLRAGDAATIEEMLRGTRREPLLEGTSRFLAEAPKHVAVVRDSEDDLRGYTITLTPRSAPEFAADDPVLGPRLADARERSGDAESVMWREAIDFTRDAASGIMGMLGMAGVLRSARHNPRFAYVPIDPRMPGAVDFATALGAEHLAELDFESGELELRCYLIDYGAGGLLAAQRDLIYRELGLEPPSVEAAGLEPATRDAVRDALRKLDLPHELASNPLARGEGLEERAASVRAVIDDAAENAFGRAEGERQLHAVLVRGYLDRAASHELAAEELSLSRAAYFRRLRTATERIAEYIAVRSA